MGRIGLLADDRDVDESEDKRAGVMLPSDVRDGSVRGSVYSLSMTMSKSPRSSRLLTIQEFAELISLS